MVNLGQEHGYHTRNHCIAVMRISILGVCVSICINTDCALWLVVCCINALGNVHHVVIQRKMNCFGKRNGFGAKNNAYMRCI